MVFWLQMIDTGASPESDKERPMTASESKVVRSRFRMLVFSTGLLTDGDDIFDDVVFDVV